MSTNQTSPLPPVPQHTKPIEEHGPIPGRFNNHWMQWFVQLRDKVNIINASLVSLAVLTAQGLIAKKADGSWASRTITGTPGRVLVTNGDGNSGNPTIDVVSSMVNGAFYVDYDFGSSDIPAGTLTDLYVPYDHTITAWVITAQQSGSIVIDVWRAANLGVFPPTVGGTITASAKPTVTSSTSAQSSTLTGWSTAGVAGNIYRFKVDSCTGIKQAQLVIRVTKS